MATRNDSGSDSELLEKLLLLQLFSMGATQSQIARFMGKSKTWVNDLLKNLPKKGDGNGADK
jgi:DNA-binding transcriptional regulator LsrR (DeoR family)